MKLSGHLKLEIVDEITGKVINTIEQDNIITDIAYSNTTMTNTCYWNANRIFISTEVANPVRTKSTIQCSGTAYIGAGQPAIQCYHNANPPYFVLTQRLDSVVTPRTFQTIGLTPDNPGQVVNTNVIPWAYLLLNSPCTQEANQILNLTYRITVQNSILANASQPLYPRWINDVCYSLVYGTSITDRQNYLYNMTASAPIKAYGWKYLYLEPSLPSMTMENNSNNGNRGLATSIGSSQNTLFYRYKQYWDFYRTNSSGAQGANGRVINGILSGYNLTRKTAAVEPDPGVSLSAHSSYSTNLTSNLQSAFAYSAAPQDNIGPMFLPSNNPSGTGAVSFSENPWTGTWPSTYRIKITESGNTGTAKFVLGVKNFTSFTSDSNFTYSNSTFAFHPYIVAGIQPYDKCHGWQLTMPILAWDDKWTVQADNSGISIINQFTGQHYDLDATTTPALPITAFRQMAFDVPNNLIYVACSNTGLWKLDITNKNSIVVTNVSTTPSYAVDVDANGVVYVFMNKTSTALVLTSSTSSYVNTLSFTTVALTTSSRLNIYVNKFHPDTRIAITVRNGTITSGLSGAVLYWWSLANGNGGSYTTNIEYCGESQCSFAWTRNSDNRFWAGNGVLFTYGNSIPINGSATKFAPAGPTNALQANYDPETLRLLSGTLLTYTNVFGNINIAQDYWGNLISFSNSATLYQPGTGASFTSYNNQSNQIRQWKRVDMLNGIVLSECASFWMSTNGMDNNLSKWIWYKWDGTNWVKAVNYNPDTNTYTDTTGVNTRTTSASNLDLLDGIKIRFQDGTTGTSFIVGEVYDQYVCKGILKTNDVYLYLDNCPLYTQPLYEQISLTPTTITLANNYGVVLDGAPGNTGISIATSAIAVTPLWVSIIPEYTPSNMTFAINGIPITGIYVETINTIPAQSTLTTGQIILYRNGLVLCSSADVGKTLTGYFSYVAKSD